MNILFLTHYDGLLGSSRSLINLLDGLNQFAVKPFAVISKDGTINQELESRHVIYSVIHLSWWVATQKWNKQKRISFSNEIKQNLPKISGIVKDKQIDLLYSNSSVFPIGRIAAKLNEIPHIWHIREFGDLDFSLNYIFPKWLCQRYICTSQAIICNSQAVRRHVFKSCKSKKLHVIYNGVASKDQFDDLAKRAKEKESNFPYTFLIIGSISPKKGQEIAITALAELNKKGLEARLIVVGSGSEAHVGQCQDLAASLDVTELVDFTGFLLDPYEAYFKSDCVLMCSEHEAFGRVTAEAMSACLPVIGRNSGGTPEVIVDGETGILYNTFDELVDAMTMMVQNPELGKQMGLAGWRRAKEKFNIEDYAANVYQVIQSVMKK